MGNKNSGLDRRQVLKLVMIGGVATAVVMPSKWVKPVVNAVIPPAHAAASAAVSGTVTTSPSANGTNIQGTITTPQGTCTVNETATPTSGSGSTGASFSGNISCTPK
jgi:hypothetical protein